MKQGGTAARGPDPSVRNRARIAGAAATAVALGVLWAISGFVDGVPFLPATIGQAIVRATPGDVATFFIEVLGHWALRLLTVGAVVATLVFGALALAVTARAAITAAALGVATFALTALLPAMGKNVIAIAIASGLAALGYFWIAGATLRTPLASESPADGGRRRVLRAGFGGAAGVVLGTGVLGWIGRKLAGPNTDVPIAAPAARATPPARSDFPKVTGLSPEVTSAADHYVVDINLFKPSVEVDGWTLEVKGLVESPLALTFAELQERFEIVEEYSVLTCVSNEVGGPLIGNSAWGGVRLVDVLDAAGVQPGAADIVFRSAEGYSDSITIEHARDPDVLLAISQNGEPLTQEHGFPCRVRVPRIYGMKNVKWLTSIEVAGRDYQGYWQRRGWSDDATVRTQSRIDVAGRDRIAKAGAETWIAGVAWAGERGVSKVEVSTNGGETWEEAVLREPLADNAWRQWAYRWTPGAKGTLRVACRATDGRGDVQPAREQPPHPSGATGYHIVDVDVS